VLCPGEPFARLLRHELAELLHPQVAVVNSRRAATSAINMCLTLVAENSQSLQCSCPLSPTARSTGHARLVREGRRGSTSGRVHDVRSERATRGAERARPDFLARTRERQQPAGAAPCPGACSPRRRRPSVFIVQIRTKTATLPREYISRDTRSLRADVRRATNPQFRTG